MKTRLFLLISLLLGTTSMFAQGWVPKTNVDYLDETVYWVNLSIAPATSAGTAEVTLAAFIDGECRALTEYATEGYYELRVAGDLATEANKDIVFKAFAKEGNDGPLIYVFNTKGSFTGGNGYFNFPLTLDLFQGVSLPATINVVGNLPMDYDLSQHFTYNFGEGGASTNVELEAGQLSYSWEYVSSTSISSISSANVLTTTSTGGSTDVTLNITGPVYKDANNYDYPAYSNWGLAGTTIVVAQGTVPVTSINLNPTSVTVMVGDYLNTKLNDLVQVEVLPANASDKTFYWDYTGASAYIDPASSYVTARGATKVVCKSESNPSVSAILIVNIQEKPTFKIPNEVTLSLKEEIEVDFTDFNDPDDLFDPTLVTVDLQGAANMGNTAIKARVDDTGYSCFLQGRYAGEFSFQVYYDGIPMETVSGYSMCNAHVEARLELPTDGWSWVSVCYVPNSMVPYQYPWILLEEGGVNAPFMSKVQEMRTQTGLLYNDNGTFYGSIDKLAPANGMYKVRGNNTGANVINLGADALVMAKNDGWTNYSQYIKKGYNWITYPYEFDLEVSELATQLSANAVADDQIIGQQGFATYDGATWTATTGFKFEAGKGYIYLSQNNTPYEIVFDFNGTPLCYMDGFPVREEYESDLWEVKNDGFIDNMPAILQIQDLTESDSYVIGAFVDGECRGEAPVQENGVALLSVAGKTGEKVSFRLYNKESGEEIALDETLRHAASAGRISAPLQFAAPTDATGISAQRSQQADGQQSLYNISGQRVNRVQRGVYIVNGKKVIK